MPDRDTYSLLARAYNGIRYKKIKRFKAGIAVGPTGLLSILCR
jgi:hypothetical protein